MDSLRKRRSKRLATQLIDFSPEPLVSPEPKPDAAAAPSVRPHRPDRAGSGTAPGAPVLGFCSHPADAAVPAAGRAAFSRPGYGCLEQPCPPAEEAEAVEKIECFHKEVSRRINRAGREGGCDRAQAASTGGDRPVVDIGCSDRSSLFHRLLESKQTIEQLLADIEQLLRHIKE